MSAPRLKNAIQRGLEGTYKSFNDSAKDIRNHISPLIDLGLYDTARRLLGDLEYGPEEREMIINPLSDKGIASINRIPNVKTQTKQIPSILGGIQEERFPDLNNIKQGLIELKKNDPNYSLLLARKAFEDKGYDWREFKNALNELMSEGYKLEDDQQNQLGRLDTPPLNKLEKILEGITIGR